MTSRSKTRVTTSHWGAFRVITEGNRIVATDVFEADPYPSSIASALPAAVHHKTRVARPSFRRGWLDGGDRARLRRGADEFVELPWDEALDITAAELQRVIAEHGNGSIFGGSYGWASAGRFHHAQSQLHRFLNQMGGYVRSRHTYSNGALTVIMPHVVGSTRGYLDRATDWSVLAEHTDLFVCFAGLPMKNTTVLCSRPCSRNAPRTRPTPRSRARIMAA